MAPVPNGKPPQPWVSIAGCAICAPRDEDSYDKVYKTTTCLSSRHGSGFGSDDDEHSAFANTVAHADAHGRDDAIFMREKRVLHLHGLEDNEALAAHHLGTGRNQDGHDLPWDGSYASAEFATFHVGHKARHFVEDDRAAERVNEMAVAIDDDASMKTQPVSFLDDDVRVRSANEHDGDFTTSDSKVEDAAATILVVPIDRARRRRTQLSPPIGCCESRSSPSRTAVLRLRSCAASVARQRGRSPCVATTRIQRDGVALEEIRRIVSGDELWMLEDVDEA